MVSENNQIIDGWVFCSTAGILTTPLGEALSNSLKNKTGIKLWGSLDKNNGKCHIPSHGGLLIRNVQLNNSHMIND
jgi:hypothetical protein